MEEKETFTMYDEYGREREVTIIDVIEIQGQEYLLYSAKENEEEDAIYASKIIKDEMGNEEIVSITNEEERRIVFDTIREIINELD